MPEQGMLERHSGTVPHRLPHDQVFEAPLLVRSTEATNDWTSLQLRLLLVAIRSGRLDRRSGARSVLSRPVPGRCGETVRRGIEWCETVARTGRTSVPLGASCHVSNPDAIRAPRDQPTPGAPMFPSPADPNQPAILPATDSQRIESEPEHISAASVNTGIDCTLPPLRHCALGVGAGLSAPAPPDGRPAVSVCARPSPRRG